ncbi:MAG: hypothetical protein WA978_12205 [Sphingopyxis granuli]
MPRPAKPALERIARTLCSRKGLPENTQFEGKPMWQSFLADAQAVLGAIREPTEEMIAAGSGITREEFDAFDDALRRKIADEARDEATRTWEAMIDAALLVKLG